MAKFRKKPVVIEAEIYRAGLEDGFVIRHDPAMFTSDDFVVARSMNIAGQPEYATPVYSISALEHIAHKDPEYLDDLVPFISTLEGRHFISDGDWIITGIKGERYPCKPDTFAETYEPVE